MNEVETILSQVEHMKQKIALWESKGRMDRVKEYKTELKRVLRKAEKMNDEAEMSK